MDYVSVRLAVAAQLGEIVNKLSRPEFRAAAQLFVARQSNVLPESEVVAAIVEHQPPQKAGKPRPPEERAAARLGLASCLLRREQTTVRITVDWERVSPLMDANSSLVQVLRRPIVCLLMNNLLAAQATTQTLEDIAQNLNMDAKVLSYYIRRAEKAGLCSIEEGVVSLQPAARSLAATIAWYFAATLSLPQEQAEQ